MIPSNPIIYGILSGEMRGEDGQEDVETRLSDAARAGKP